MKKAVLILILAALPLSLYSQQKPAAAPKPEAAAPAAKADEEDGAVMIDGSDPAPAPAYSAPADEEAPEPRPRRDTGALLPSSLGDLRGTFTDGGRHILVLQGDDGSINFVQVTLGGPRVSWKSLGSIYRSRD